MRSSEGESGRRSTRGRASILGGLAALALAVSAGPALGLAVSAGPALAAVKPASHTVAVPRPATTQSGYGGKWGLYAPDFPGTMATVRSLQAEVGRRADYVMWYEHWAGPYSAFNAADVEAAAANGSTPVITWLSDDPSRLTTITDRAIAAGRYDGYIRSWALGLRSLGIPVLLRLDPEMNGNWYGWSPGVNGQTAAEYVAAFRHVHDVFAGVGARNVAFVWSPNVAYPGATPMESLYPGDAYVSWVGLDGYNWGTTNGHQWQTPAEVFGSSVSQLRAITRRPMLITEVASTSVGGDKSAWIDSFFSYLRSDPSISGFIWFDASKETDWQIDSSPLTLAAFRAGLTGA
ncbi:MAG: glycoside hydrolase family 26 protein [Acidimicrobiales bacterium]